MKLTNRLKKWLVDQCGVKASATDDEFRKAAGIAMAQSEDEDGYLSVEKFAELTRTKDDDDASEVVSVLRDLKDTLAEVRKANAPQPSATADDAQPSTDKSADEGADDAADDQPAPLKAGKPGELSKQMARMAGHGSGVDDDDPQVRVKRAVESYASTKSALTYPERSHKGSPHPLAGRPVTEFGMNRNSASDRDKALAGAWAKFQIAAVTTRIAGSAQRAFEVMSEHEKDLLHHLCEKEAWDASEDRRVKSRTGYPGGIKALIDDATSGGLEAAPIVFDDMVIETPLLMGELFPLVNTIPLDRGRRVEGVSTGTVTGSWGGVDDSVISLFTTTGYVSAFDTTIHRWQGAIRVGLDFMSDTPIDFGAHITRQYGERLMEDLDDVIATGNGTTQPEGIMTKSGTTSVNFASATSIGNYESLRFGVAKPEHRANLMATAVFCGTETSYQRARAIPVGAADARRIFGLDYDSYRLMERPYKINESLTNAQIFYAILGRYRMYRRRGLVIRTSTEGDTLIRNNELLIVAMARYGGQLERGACAAVTSTAPA